MNVNPVRLINLSPIILVKIVNTIVKLVMIHNNV